MKFLNWNDYQKTRIFSCAYFIAIGLVNLLDGLLNDRFFPPREIGILLLMCLPPLINRRLFYLASGFLGSLISLVIFILYIIAFLQSPLKPDSSAWYFLLGCLVFSAGLLASLGLFYIGTYTGEKNSFWLV